MKSNSNIFKYIFALVVVALIVGAVYILYYSQNTTDEEANEEGNSNETTDVISVVENLKMGISDYDTINPLLTKNKEIVNIDKLIFEPLISITSDYCTELCLAKSCTKISDKTYEIKIDTSIKWQDGSSFIARDVQFTIEKLKEVDSIYSYNVRNIQSVETPDSETLKITLTQNIPFFEYYLDFPILSSAYYFNEDFQNSNKIPIGTGMYKIASNDENNIFLIINDRWRKAKTDTPKTKSITVHKYVAIGEMFNSFKLGNIDIINTQMTNYTDYVGTMGYNKKEYVGRNYDFISFNCQDSILSSKAVRIAINYGINKVNLVSTVFANQKVVANSPLDYGSYLYNKEEIIEYNQSEAKKILEQDGWLYTNDRWQKSIDGYVRRLTISLIVSDDSNGRVNAAENIKSQLKEIGINVNVIKVTREKYYEYLDNKNYQMVLTGLINSINPDLSYFYGNNNIANYNNQEIISKLNSIEGLKEAQKIANEDVPYIGLYRDKGTILLNANVGGEFAPNNYFVYYNFNKWFRQQ